MLRLLSRRKLSTTPSSTSASADVGRVVGTLPICTNASAVDGTPPICTDANVVDGIPPICTDTSVVDGTPPICTDAGVAEGGSVEVSTRPAPLLPAAAASARALSTCLAGSRATVLEVRCGHADACRLRALGLCEGAAVSVVNARDCTLLEVRGSRLAVSSAIAAGIMVMPIL